MIIPNHSVLLGALMLWPATHSTKVLYDRAVSLVVDTETVLYTDYTTVTSCCSHSDLQTAPCIVTTEVTHTATQTMEASPSTSEATKTITYKPTTLVTVTVEPVIEPPTLITVTMTPTYKDPEIITSHSTTLVTVTVEPTTQVTVTVKPTSKITTVFSETISSEVTEPLTTPIVTETVTRPVESTVQATEITTQTIESTTQTPKTTIQPTNPISSVSTRRPRTSPTGPWQDYQTPGLEGTFLFAPTSIVYSPFEPNTSIKTCRSQQSILSDIDLLSSKGIEEIRIYSTDCDAISFILPAAANAGIKVLLGFSITNNVNDVDPDVQQFVTWAKNNANSNIIFNSISALSIGNQAVGKDIVSADDLVSKVEAVKALLFREAGYNGKIVIAETSSTYVLNPQLCATGLVDYVGLVVEPFSNPYYLASESTDFIDSQISPIPNFCSNANVRVIEAGYPSSGDAYGQQVPNFVNQGIAVTQLYNYVQGDIILYTMWDEAWADAGDWNTGGHYGLIDRLN